MLHVTDAAWLEGWRFVASFSNLLGGTIQLSPTWEGAGTRYQAAKGSSNILKLTFRCFKSLYLQGISNFKSVKLLQAGLCVTHSRTTELIDG